MATDRIDRCLRGTVAAVLLTVGIAAAHAAENYRVRLATVPIEARTSAQVKGSGSASAVLDGTRLTVNGSFAGLQSAATFGGLHQGAVTGVRGPQIAQFAVPAAQSGSFAAEVTLTREQAQSLTQGRLYLQIHSTEAPEGNLWGWLLE
jgi:hypothetical protein